jgi:hypothetical protein
VIWCETVEQALRQRVMVYTGPAFVRQFITYAGLAGAEAVAALGRRPLVVAHYTGDYARLPTVPRPWSDWTIWQASGGRAASPNYATLPSHPTVDVDVDWFRGTVDDLIAVGSLP